MHGHPHIHTLHRAPAQQAVPAAPVVAVPGLRVEIAVPVDLDLLSVVVLLTLVLISLLIGG